jgi:F-type H+-transporting ATPase subunit b
VQLDWFTVAAEIVNFLILVALLKYFLYDRIIGIADERESKIAARFDEAEEKRQEADKEAETYQTKRQELEEQRETLMSEAKEEAEKRRRELIAQARDEVDAQKRQWQQMIERDQDAFLKGLRQEAAQQTIAAARRTLVDLAGADLESQIIDRFLRKLRELPEEEQAKIVETLQASGQKPVITTAFDLTAEHREHLISALHEQFGDGLEGKFDTAPSLICGIQLKANGHKIAWNLEHYLDNLAGDLSRVLQEELPEKDAKENEA